MKSNERDRQKQNEMFQRAKARMGNSVRALER